MNKTNKLQWAKKLKVGDTVCDCRFLHMKIKSIEPYYIHQRCPLINIICADWFPHKFGDWIMDSWFAFVSKINWRKICDFTLILEDDSRCSAIHCCDPADHIHKE